MGIHTQRDVFDLQMSLLACSNMRSTSRVCFDGTSFFKKKCGYTKHSTEYLKKSYQTKRRLRDIISLNKGNMSVLKYAFDYFYKSTF